jgi:hypothetical protein
MLAPDSRSIRQTERTMVIRCMVAALALAALSVSLIYGLV